MLKTNPTKKIRRFAMSLIAALVCCASPATGYGEEPSIAPHIDLPVKKYVHADQKKLAVATELTQWMNGTLQNKKALVAVVARNARPVTAKYDATGMGHVGLAVYDPRVKSWLFYHLLNDVVGKKPTASLYVSAPLDFFYDQRGYKKEALILLPDPKVQQRIYNAILDQEYKKLAFTPKYSLTSGYDNTLSLNCTKWILMNLVAAQIGNYDPDAVLQAVHDIPPSRLKPNRLVRAWFSWRKPEVVPEFYPDGSWRTVTAESLYRSDLFTEKTFFSGKILNLPPI